MSPTYKSTSIIQCLGLKLVSGVDAQEDHLDLDSVGPSEPSHANAALNIVSQNLQGWIPRCIGKTMYSRYSNQESCIMKAGSILFRLNLSP